MTSLPTALVTRVLLPLRYSTPVTDQYVRERLEKPKDNPNPPSYLYRHNDITVEQFGQFFCFEVEAKHTSKPTSAVLYLHGGAYVDEIVKQHWELIGKLAAGGCRVVVPIYGLAPEFTHKDAFPFVARCYQKLLSPRMPHITVMGDSAGGGLALAFAETLPVADRPDRLVLIAPWLDITLSNPAIKQIKDPWLRPAWLQHAARAWAGGDDLTIPQLSPINGDLSGLPPIDLFIGTSDILYPDANRLADLSISKGVATNLIVAQGAFHVFPLVSWVPEGKAASQAIVERASLDLV